MAWKKLRESGFPAQLTDLIKSWSIKVGSFTSVHEMMHICKLNSILYWNPNNWVINKDDKVKFFGWQVLGLCLVCCAQFGIFGRPTVQYCAEGCARIEH